MSPLRPGGTNAHPEDTRLATLDDVAEPPPSPSLADAALRERRRIVAQLRAAGLYLAADIVERGQPLPR